MSIVNVASMVDVPCNWRRLTCWRQSDKNYPDGAALKSGLPCVVDEMNVVLRNIDDVIEVRDWLKGNTKSKFELLGRFEFRSFPYRIDRSLVGVNFRFDDPQEAFFFKMRWF